MVSGKSPAWHSEIVRPRPWCLPPAYSVREWKLHLAVERFSFLRLFCIHFHFPSLVDVYYLYRQVNEKP